MSMVGGHPNKPNLPLCVDCGKRANQFIFRDDASDGQRNGTVKGGAEWLCSKCMYLREFPNAEPIKFHPLSLDPIPLQAERLFEP